MHPNAKIKRPPPPHTRDGNYSIPVGNELCWCWLVGCCCQASVARPLRKSVKTSGPSLGVYKYAARLCWCCLFPGSPRHRANFRPGQMRLCLLLVLLLVLRPASRASSFTNLLLFLRGRALSDEIPFLELIFFNSPITRQLFRPVVCQLFVLSRGFCIAQGRRASFSTNTQNCTLFLLQH